MLSAAYCDHISKVQFTREYCKSIINNCYHSDNVIKNVWPKSDNIKRLLLYFYLCIVSFFPALFLFYFSSDAQKLWLLISSTLSMFRQSRFVSSSLYAPKVRLLLLIADTPATFLQFKSGGG